MNIKLPVDFFKRLGYFLVGLTIGLFVLNYFMSKKSANFDYLPNARTLKSIRNKAHFEYTPEVADLMQQHQIDSVAIQSMLYYGKIKFNKSNRGKAPCHTYLIEPTKKSAPISITIKRCDSVATLIKLEVKK